MPNQPTNHQSNPTHIAARENWLKEHGKDARKRRLAERTGQPVKKSRRVSVQAQTTTPPRMMIVFGEEVVDPLEKWERDFFDELEASLAP